MKTKVNATVIAIIAAVASLCMAGSPSSSPDMDAVAALRNELQETRVQLQQVIARTGALEQQVRALAQSHAQLEHEILTLQSSRGRPEPRWETNHEPHLTPLQTK